MTSSRVASLRKEGSEGNPKWKRKMKKLIRTSVSIAIPNSKLALRVIARPDSYNLSC